MEKLENITSVALPLPIDNLDTDQIMPKQFLKGIDKSGLAKGVFFNMRCFPDGRKRVECLFNQPEYAGAQVIVSGPNFGCGSSREHAVWGLQQIGIKAVIAPGFGEIFYSNCFNNGVLAAKVTSEDGQEILEAVTGREPVEISVNVKKAEIFCQGRRWKFQIAPRHQRMLLEGLDMVESTLKDLDAIKEFQRRHEVKFPWMAGLAGKAKRILMSKA